MIFNRAGLSLIKEFEGCSFVAYQDQGGKWTCGWGSTGPDVVSGVQWTQEQCDARRDEDIDTVAKQVVSLLINDQLTPNQFSAIVCFAYNLGYGNLEKSTLLNCINTFHLQDAANEFERWSKVSGAVVPGLLRRRQAEKALFLTV